MSLEKRRTRAARTCSESIDNAFCSSYTLQDVRRFRNAKSVGAYLGLTPSQESTGEKTRLGRITKQGQGSVRALLVEASWRIIGRDVGLGRKYDEIKHRSGSKRAIVAIARRLAIRMRCLLINREGYALTVA